jgi:alkylation response protein AidB-like acyl-CoA dehydrogenase
MDLRFSEEDEGFRREVRDWLEGNLTGEFADARGLGGPGSEHEGYEVRHAWEQRLADGGWTCIGWPKVHGGRGATVTQQVVFHEEYARSRAPARVGIFGEGLLGPTVIAFGTEEQQRRFLPPIVRAEELWCQGYSEPNAGSDLANVQTRAERDGDEWVITGQKVWTSLAHWADWIFVLCRTDRDAPRHKGISYLLCPMRQDGIEVRPIEQVTGTSEFNEVFFDGARTAAENVVGDVNGGWRVAMGTLAFERGTLYFGQQIGFERELAEVVDLARANGAIDDAVVRDRIAQAWAGLRVMRFHNLRTLHEGEPGPEASVNKLFWSNWHRELGNLAMDVQGMGATMHEAPLQRIFLFSRSDTIYAGSNEIQRNIIGEQALGLPREPK